METLQSIIDWQVATFGKGTPERLLERAGEEWEELNDAVKCPCNFNRAAAMEAADVIIVLAGFLNACGYPDAVEEKMKINRARTWASREDGTGYHVKE